jgi:hypothetical protein
VREVDHSPPSIAEVKNEWRCTSTPQCTSWPKQGRHVFIALLSNDVVSSSDRIIQ